MRYTLKKSEILRGRKSFKDVFERGRKFEHSHLRCFYIIDELRGDRSASIDSPGVSTGFAVSRQFSRAVDRNRIKRLMRESYRMHKQNLTEKCRKQLLDVKVVLLYLSSSGGSQPLPSFAEIDSAMQVVLDSINLTAAQ